jgi:hypothetical protein
VRESIQTGRVPYQLVFILDQELLIRKEVDLMIEKGPINPVEDSSGEFISQLFLVSIKDGGQRPVVN